MQCPMKFDRSTQSKPVQKPAAVKRGGSAKQSGKPSGPTITSDLAKVALETDVENIRARAAAGKPLTGKQRAVLAAVAGGLDPGRDVSSFTATIVDLADAIGVDRRTIGRWLKLPDNPGREADGRFSVEAWLAYKATRPVCGGDYLQKCRRIELQNQKLEWELSQLQGKYVRLSDVEKWAPELCETITGIVRGSLVRLAPELRLCSVPDAESRLKGAEDRILTRLHTIGTA